MIYIYLLLSLSAIIIIGITTNPIIILAGIPWAILWIFIFKKYGGVHPIITQKHEIENNVFSEHSKPKNQVVIPEEVVQQVIMKIKQYKNVFQFIGIIIITIIASVIMFLGEQ